MTDFEADWEDDADFFNYRHRRRLSDPSANLNNFNRYAFRSMAPTADTAAGKARSENEGLDNLANELYEVEAGDLRDGMWHTIWLVVESLRVNVGVSGWASGRRFHNKAQGNGSEINLFAT